MKGSDPEFTPYTATVCAERKMEYENATPEQQQRAYSYLIKAGMIGTLPGHFGRTANNLVVDGYLDRAGNILKPLTENV